VKQIILDSTKKETRAFWKINIHPEMLKMKLEDILEVNSVSMNGKLIVPTKVTIDVQHISSNPPVQPNWYLVDGAWHNCVTVFDGKEAKCYVDGELQE